VNFTEQDEYGVKARLVLQEQSDAGELGLIVRRSVQGQPWAAKDGTRDRFIPLYYASDHGRLAVWLMQDDPRIYYREEDVDRTPKLTLASLDDTSSIRVECYLPVYVSGQNWGFALYQGEEEIPLALVESFYTQGSPKTFILKTAYPLDLTKRYRLCHATHGELQVSLGRAFDSAEFQAAFHYDGADLGVTLTPNKTMFKVWAPTADRLEVVLYAEGVGGRGKKLPMTLGDKGVWSAVVPENLEGKFYTYLVTHGQKRKRWWIPMPNPRG